MKEFIKKDILLKYCYIHLPKVFAMLIYSILCYLTFLYVSNLIILLFILLFYLPIIILRFFLKFRNLDGAEIFGCTIMLFIPFFGFFFFLDLIKEYEIKLTNRL
jgi:hypothetical protein